MVYTLRLLTCVVLVCAATSHAPGARAFAATPSIPLRTELILPLDSAHLQEGSVVLVRVDSAWTGSGCALRAGSVVEGHALMLRRRLKGIKNSEVQLLFDAADCDGHHESAFPFTLVAVIGFEGTHAAGISGITEAPPLANAIGGRSGMRGAASLVAIDPQFDIPVRQLPAQILPGQVLGVRNMFLHVGIGRNGASTLEAVGHDFRLEQGTNLILTHEAADAGVGMESEAAGDAPVPPPAREATKPVPAGEPEAEGNAAPHQPPAPVVPEIPDETGACVGPCRAVWEPAIEEDSAMASISLAALGYLPGTGREFRFLNFDTVLTYLDRRRLLCTFDPRYLRHRAGWNQDSVRTIKAVLINPETRSVQQVLDWHVQGAQQYLWRIAPGRFLVHTGGELRELDAQLRTIHSIPVDGKVAWVVSSPTADYIAVGIVRERYSEAVERVLESTLSALPEEDVEVRVFDGERRLLAATLQSSHLPAPVLSDAGELRLEKNGNAHWTIAEHRWDNKERLIAIANSTCTPVLSTPARGMVFAMGCTGTGGRWYRMLREDGHPLLKGETASDTVAIYTQGVDDEEFAVGTVEAVRSKTSEQPLGAAHSFRENIAVYSSRSGAKLASVTAGNFTLAQLAFALSPSGNQLAVMGRDSVLLYPVRLDRR